MKLTQIMESQLSPEAADHLKRIGSDFSTNGDGSIDIRGNFTAYDDLPEGFPKINRVHGDYTMEESYNGSSLNLNLIPTHVDGNCVMHVPSTIAASQLPISTNGAGDLIISGADQLFLDDDKMFNYKTTKLDIQCTGDLGFLPRQLTTPALRIHNTIENIPPVLHVEALLMSFDDPDTMMKGFHKRFTDVSAKTVILFCGKTTPLLGLFKIKGMTALNIMYTGIGPAKALNNILNNAIQGDGDIFAVQEMLIDAGFKDHAKR